MGCWPDAAASLLLVSGLCAVSAALSTDGDGALRLGDLLFARKGLVDWRGAAGCKLPLADRCLPSDGSTQCLGAELPAELRSNFSKVGTVPNLDAYQSLDGLPRCWPLLRTILCAVASAPCFNGSVRLLPSSQCRTVRKECQFLVDHNAWPELLGNCTDPQMFSESCEMYFEFPKWDDVSQIPKKCVPPLVYSNDTDGWVVPHCALNCSSPWLSADQRLRFVEFVNFRMPVAFAITLLLLVCIQLGVVQPPDCVIPLKWALFSRLLILSCWMANLSPYLRQLISCNDGAIRMRQNLILGQFSPCVIQFIVLYVCRVQAVCYMALFFYYQRLLGGAVVSRRKSMRLLRTVIVGTSVFVSIVIVGFFNVVDSNGIDGLCFVGLQRPKWTLILYTFPASIFVVLWVVLYYCALKFRYNCPSVAVQTGFSVPRLSVFLLFHLTLHLFNAAFVAYEAFALDKRQQSLLAFVVCRLKGGEQCELANRPLYWLLECVALTEFLSPLFDGLFLVLCSRLTLSGGYVGRVLGKSSAPRTDVVSADQNSLMMFGDNVTLSDGDVQTVPASCRTHRSSREFYKRFRMRSDLKYLRKHFSLSSLSGWTFSATRSLPSHLCGSLPSLPFPAVEGHPPTEHSGMPAAQGAPTWPGCMPPPFFYPYVGGPPGTNPSTATGPAGANPYMQMYYAWVNWMQMVNCQQPTANTSSSQQQQPTVPPTVAPNKSSPNGQCQSSTNRSSEYGSDSEEYDSEECDSDEEAFVEQQLLSIRSQKVVNDGDRAQ